MTTIRRTSAASPPPAEIDTPARHARALRWMNKRHAVVKESGKTLVLNEEHDEVLGRRLTTRSSFTDIRSFYKQLVMLLDDDGDPVLDGDGDPIWWPLGKWWLNLQDRRQYERVTFAPGQDVPDDYLNLWTGFAVEPKEGDWSLYQTHLLDVVCRGDADLYLFLLGWFASGIQKPWEKPESAIILKSEERGTGKSLACRFYRQLFGQHGVEVSNPAHLTGRFNAHMEDCCVLVLTEGFWAGSHEAESVLKALITEPMIAIERKGVDLRFAPSCTRVMMTSNSEWVVPAGLDERRFLVLHVDPKHKQDTTYFGALVEQMDSGGLEAMLYDLQHHDYSSVDLRNPPSTEALMEQKLLSMDPRDRWLFDKLHDGEMLPGDEWFTEIDKHVLHEDYREHLKQTGVHRRRTATELGIFLKSIFGPELRDVRRREGADRKRYWEFPDLHDARRLFDQRLGSSYDWPAAGPQRVGTRKRKPAAMPIGKAR